MRGRTVAVLTVAAVLVAGAGTAAAWLLTRPSGPDAAASAYLGALAAKDGAAAAARLEPTLRTDAVTGAFAGATAFLTDPVVRSTSERGDRASAEVSFRLGGADRRATLTLTRTNGAWLLGSDALGDIAPSTTLGDSVTVGRVTAPTTDPWLLLPAVYTVTAAPTGVLTGSARATVLPGARVDATVAATVSPDAAATAAAQLAAYEDQCTVTADSVPAHCGLRVPWAADLATLDTLAYRIDGRPRLALAADGRSFAATGGTVVATAKGTTREGAPATFTYRAQDWALRGSVSFAGGRMTLAVD